MTSAPIRVVVVDDHPAVRVGVKALLGLVNGIDVVGEAATSDEAVQVIDTLIPDVVLMDLRMPGVGGLETTRLVTRAHRDVAVLVLTMIEDDASIYAAIRAGARGYLRKESGSEELARAVTAAANGEFITSPGIASRVAAFFSSSASIQSPVAYPELTEREREILDLIASGRNNDAIARHLFLSPKTVRNHISSIFAKLHAADRAEAIVKARDVGMGGQSPHTLGATLPRDPGIGRTP